MNTKILISLLTIGVASAGLGYGTFAFFSDTETATGNLFTAGDLDLTLNGLNGITGTINGANFAPGDSTSGSIILRNEGSIFTGDAQGHIVNLDFDVAVTITDDLGSADPEDGGVSGELYAKYLNVTSFSYGSTNLLGAIGDRDSDGRANTVADLALTPAYLNLADPGAAGQTLSIGVHFAEDGGNELKRDVADLSFTFFLAQAGETDLS